jgi:signal transduction histidine kinase
VKRNPFEDSLISVFRLFIGIRLALAILSLLAQPFHPEQPIATFTQRNGPDFFSSVRLSRLQPSPWPSIIEASLLLLFLSSPWLRRKMGRFYLPLALGVATLAPVLENLISIDFSRLDEAVIFRSVAGQWQLVIFLLVPLILMSWLYSFRVVVGYAVGLAVIDIAWLAIMMVGVGRVLPDSGVIIFRTFSFLLVGYIVNRLANEQRRQNTQLIEANRQLASYASTLEELTTSRERNRLAREFHDTVAHTLSAVAVQLEAVHSLWKNNPAKAQVMLENSLAATRNGLKESRRAIQALRASPLEDLGLSLAVSNLARAMAERESLELDLHVEEKLPPLNSDAEHSFYRVTEEALRNIAQHAQARHLSVRLEPRDHQVILTIQDDGKGFLLDNQTPARKDDHYGLQGMREYAEHIGASLTIQSQPEKGTMVQMQMVENQIPHGGGQ